MARPKRRRNQRKNLSLSKQLEKIYYSPKSSASFGREATLYKSLKKEGLSPRRKQIQEWLDTQATFDIHRPLKRKFKRNRVMAQYVNEHWQADLCDLTSLSEYNDNFTFLLTICDVLSKQARVVPLRNKGSDEIVRAFKDVFSGKYCIKKKVPSRKKISKREEAVADFTAKESEKCQFLTTDQGKEFLNKDLQQLLQGHAVQHITSYSDVKACVVERFNRTLKDKMWRYFSSTGGYRYIDILQDLVHSYNHTFHSTIKMEPAAVNKDTFKMAFKNAFDEDWPGQPKQTLKGDLAVRDIVRVSLVKNVFEKGYTPNWSTETFTIDKVLKRKPLAYKLMDSTNSLIKGIFYRQELQKLK